jgi:hypothetical protein
VYHYYTPGVTFCQQQNNEGSKKNEAKDTFVYGRAQGSAFSDPLRNDIDKHRK